MASPIWVRKSVCQPVVATTLSSCSLPCKQQDPLVLELLVLVGDGGESFVDSADQRGDLAGLEDRLADGFRLVFPGFEECVAVGLRQGRRNRRQLLIGVLVETGVGGDDQIGLQA